MIIYPPRNLPPAAQQWGRAVENRQRNLNSEQLQTRSSLDNFNRATSSSLAVNGRSLDELSIRRQVPINFANLLQTVTVPAFGSVVANRTSSVTISSPDGERRKSLLLISGNFVQAPESGTFSNVGFQLSSEGSILRRSGFAPVAVSAPAGWTESFNASILLTIGTNTLISTLIQATVSSGSATSQTVMVGVQDISATIIFGGRV